MHSTAQPVARGTATPGQTSTMWVPWAAPVQQAHVLALPPRCFLVATSHSCSNASRSAGTFACAALHDRGSFRAGDAACATRARQAGGKAAR